MAGRKNNKIIPGFGLSMGVTMAFLSFIVLIPMLSIFINSSGLTFGEFIATVTDKRIMAGYRISLFGAFWATLINCFFGVILAWVLVRYRFPGRRILDGLIELPFALPTAVAGIALTTLYSDKGWIGSFFDRFGIKISYTRIGIVIAMIFIGIPFIVRSIQPVLEKMDDSYEEAAAILGAGKVRTFFKVIFPEIVPAMLTGFGLAFARAVGEYGSVVFIAGNTPYETEIAPLLIMTKLEQYNYAEATAIALVMLGISFLILLVINSIQVYTSKFTNS